MNNKMALKQIILDFLYPGLLDELDNYKTETCYYRQKYKELNNEVEQLSNLKFDLKIYTDKIEEQLNELKSLEIKLVDSETKCSILEDKLKQAEKLNDELYTELLAKQSELSKLDSWLHKKYEIVANKVYKQKRKFNGQDIEVFLNQLITPNAFEVQRIKKDIKMTDSVYNNVFAITDKIAKLTTWTSDDTLYNTNDFYNYPEETIAIKKADCECISNTIASFMPEEIGVAYGFYNYNGYKEYDKGFGHAFNVFLWNNELYISEGTTNDAEIHWYNPENSKEKYHILFIITKDYTYKCTDENIEFGYLVNW
jgi:hypothetical protein